MKQPFLSHLGYAFGACAVALIATLDAGCETGDSTVRPANCTSDAGATCGSPTGGTMTGSGGGAGSGGSGGSTASNDIEGDVGILNEASFSFVTPYLGDAIVSAMSTSGMLIESAYGPMKPTFSLPSVMSGSTWFFLQDQTNGGTGIFSTHSIVSVPASGPITLPVVDRNIVASIAAGLPSPIVVDNTRGLLIMKVVRNGQPLSGVSLTTSLGTTDIAYDTGPGLYSNDAMQTGTGGTILVFNLDAPANAELRDLTLTDATQQGFFVQVRVQAGTATYAGFDL